MRFRTLQKRVDEFCLNQSTSQENREAFRQIDLAITEYFGDVLSGLQESDGVAGTADVKGATFDASGFLTKEQAKAFLERVRTLKTQGLLTPQNRTSLLDELATVTGFSGNLKSGSRIDFAASVIKGVRATAIAGYYLGFLWSAEKSAKSCLASQELVSSTREYIATDTRFSAERLAQNSCGADAAEIMRDTAAAGFLPKDEAAAACARYSRASFNIVGKRYVECPQQHSRRPP